MANGTPVIATKILGRTFAYPVDFGIAFWDGQPLFGASKTLRGIVLAVLLTSVAAALIGLEWTFGALIAVTAMFGDLLSSFIRRMGLIPSSQCIGLDQIPESLFSACGLPIPFAFDDPRDRNRHSYFFPRRIGTVPRTVLVARSRSAILTDQGAMCITWAFADSGPHPATAETEVQLRLSWNSKTYC